MSVDLLKKIENISQSVSVLLVMSFQHPEAPGLKLRKAVNVEHSKGFLARVDSVSRKSNVELFSEKYQEATRPS